MRRRQPDLADGGLALTGWGILTVDRQEAYLLRLDADYELSCLGLRDDGGPAPLFGGVAAADAGRTYVSGYIFSGQFRTVVTTWD